MKERACGGRRSLLTACLRAIARLAVCMAWLVAGPAAAEKIAEGGSPLYSFAVHESVESLKGLGKPESAEQGKVCLKCGKVHPPQGVSTNHAAEISASGEVPVGQPCPKCGKVHPPAGSGVHTNGVSVAAGSQSGASEGKNGEYYYCTKCKTYHRRKPTLPVLSSPPEPGILGSLLGDPAEETKTLPAK